MGENGITEYLQGTKEVWGYVFNPGNLGNAGRMQAIFTLLKESIVSIIMIYIGMCAILAFIRLIKRTHADHQARPAKTKTTGKKSADKKPRLTTRYLRWLLDTTIEFFTPIDGFFLIGRWKLFLIPIILGLIPFVNYIVTLAVTFIVGFPVGLLLFSAFMIIILSISFALAKIFEPLIDMIHFSSPNTGAPRGYSSSKKKNGDLGTYKDASGYTRVVDSDGYARDFGGNKIGKLGSNGKVKDLTQDHSRHLF